MSFWAFSFTVFDLSTDVVPFLAALCFASLVRTRTDLMLAIANLCLLMELVATIANPDYHFIDLMAPRLIACILQMIAACYIVALWRQRQRRLRSIAAH
ncbi:MAG: hypothetical protein OEU92_24840 [Alphaproteobacteria bacterium]|nr:hypothetical protein [Alphaproteobacteria bacterium]